MVRPGRVEGREVGRPNGTPKLTPELQKDIVSLLEIGCTIVDICNSVGISQGSYFSWKARGEQTKQEVRHLLESGVTENDAEITDLNADLYVNFLEAVTRAASRANIGAVAAIKSAIAGQNEVIERVDVTTETRLKKVKKTLENGTVVVEEVPYEYTKTLRSTTTTKLPPDWRAGGEFLRRRDPVNWSSEHPHGKGTDWEPVAIDMIKNNELSYGDLEKKVGAEKALELFTLAGRQVIQING